ncbi:MAG: diguanylate cyclase [Chloroflexi bacterium]|nr:diguanylate cyclase [Chloroflexota bacterium]
MNEFENFFNLSTDPMTIADANGRIIHVNMVYAAVTGWAVEELIIQSFWDLIHPDDHEKVRAALKTLKMGHPVFALEYRFLCKDGTHKTFLSNINRNQTSGHLYTLSRLKDIQILPYIMVANAAPVAIIIVNKNGEIVHANHLAESMFGYNAGELQNRSIEDLIPTRLRDKHQIHRMEYHNNSYNRPMGTNYNLKGLKKNGLEFRVDISLNPLYEQNELYIACSLLDITEKINTAELTLNLERENLRLSNLAQRDPLTQTYNRRFMDELFPTMANEAYQLKKNISAIMLDVDHFKKFNDTYGHQAGDQILKKLAYIAQSHIRENDILIRYGGEEFFIIMPNCGQLQASEVAERIRSSLEKNVIGLGHRITASFGISTSSITSIKLPANEILAKLIDESDKALYHAKNNGRNRVQHYSSI